ncbi:hypothetical protein PsorP6_000986 [Peronosclerospora sorghi]|uniref:Uncharacterized protein n=1 Tax=Peronosclerospora sorghi TaxID=230839 RepID=A0ACC0WSH1_9STRA|nr:hypothetical protein PsorP6_000986 [Peronosclerospora sorghi]
MMIPECTPRGTSITYESATPVPPMVYHLSLKPASSTPTTSPTSPTATAIMYVQRRPGIPTSSSTGVLEAFEGRRHGRRHKSYSESALRLERMLVPPAQPARPRPHSAGNEVDLIRTLTISGFSKNSHGTWVFKVDVGDPSDSNAYVVRRRFSDFKMLHEGLSELDELPQLPHHGIVSVLQMFVAPEKLIAARAARLQELLHVIRARPSLLQSAAFRLFIGKNPSSCDVGYVSLSGYEAPSSQPRLYSRSVDTSCSV